VHHPYTTTDRVNDTCSCPVDRAGHGNDDDDDTPSDTGDYCDDGEDDLYSPGACDSLIPAAKRVSVRSSSRHTLKIPYLTSAFEARSIRALLNSDESCRLAHGVFDPRTTTICWRHTPPMRLLLGNFVQLSLDAVSGVTAPDVSSCACQAYGAHASSRFNGHVVIASMGGLPDNLQWLFRLGQQYRPGTTDHDPTDVLTEAFQLFAGKFSPPGCLDGWVSAMHDKLSDGRTHRAGSVAAQHRAHQLLEDAMADAVAWSKVFCFLPVDKLRHNFAAVCKGQYAAALSTELFHSTVYEVSPLTSRDVALRSLAINDYWGVESGPHDVPCLSYLYGAAKLHKAEFRLRYILGVSEKLCCDTILLDVLPARNDTSLATSPAVAIQAPLTRARSAFNPAAKLLESGLKVLYHTLSLVSQMGVLAGEPPFWFATLDIDDVIVSVTSEAHAWAGAALDTGDFASMYTRLPHAMLKEAVMGLHDHARSWLVARYGRDDITLDLHRASWTQDTVPSTTRGRDALARLLDDFVDNTFINTGSVVLRQRVGIPMGGAPCPLLSTLFCSWREFLFVRTTRRALNLARFIDDSLSARRPYEPPVLTAIDYGIEFGAVDLGLSRAPFVGLSITNSDPPATCTYDRRLDFTCEVIRLPHASSSLASHIAPAIVCGALVRAWTLASCRAAFAESACLSALRVADRHCPLHAVTRGWEMFLRRLSPQFIAEERLIQIKQCCVALAGLSSAVRCTLTLQVEARARGRQRAVAIVTPPDNGAVPLSASPCRPWPDVPVSSRARLPARPYTRSQVARQLATASTTDSSATQPAESRVRATTTTATRPAGTRSTASLPLRNRHGICSHGNTCYAAVCLQLATSAQALTAGVLTTPFCQKVRLARQGRLRGPLSLSDNLLASLCPPKEDALRQNCVTECFERWLDASNVGQALCAVQVRQEIVCHTCELSSNSHPPVGNVLHFAPGSGSSLLDLQSAVSGGLRDDSDVDCTCSFCGARTVTKVNVITSTGPLLALALRRGQFDHCSNYSRSDVAVCTPLDLRITGLPFQLVGVALHHGDTANSGHYTCLVKEEDLWLQCDDACVALVSDPELYLEQHERECSLWLYARLPVDATDCNSPVVPVVSPVVPVVSPVGTARSVAPLVPPESGPGATPATPVRLRPRLPAAVTKVPPSGPVLRPRSTRRT
jgi:hypothetical protein